MAARSFLVVLVLILAGCSGPAEPDRGTDAGDDADVSDPLSAAPALDVGDWWMVELSSPLLPSGPVKWTRVVAGVDGPNYLIGQPQDRWSVEGLIFHVPGLGEVSVADLSYDTHDVLFTPLVFPLANGTRWTTAFEGREVDAEAFVLGDGRVEIAYCCGRNITAIWDPAMKAFASFDVEGLLSYKVTDHGQGHTGSVIVPRGHDLIFRHGRSSTVLAADPTSTPSDVITVPATYDRVSFVHLVGELGGSGPPSGAYRERTIAPDGTPYETEALPSDSAAFKVAFFEVDDPAGEWTLEHVAPGPGRAFTEGIAYDVVEFSVG